MELPQHFWDKVDKNSSPNGCWLWTARCSPSGYGVIYINGKDERAHRLTLSQHLGRPLSDGMLSLHKCPNNPNRKCVNPLHLKEGTQAENMADMIKDGNSTRGTKHSDCKLTEDQVREIRKSFLPGGHLGRQYGVSKNTIYDILSRRSWAWLT